METNLCNSKGALVKSVIVRVGPFNKDSCIAKYLPIPEGAFNDCVPFLGEADLSPLFLAVLLAGFTKLPLKDTVDLLQRTSGSLPPFPCGIRTNQPSESKMRSALKFLNDLLVEKHLAFTIKPDVKQDFDFLLGRYRWTLAAIQETCTHEHDFEMLDGTPDFVFPGGCPMM
jgi:hypothetical protein